MYKVLDLFSGIGGFSLGLERTGGYKTVAFCEIEEFPKKALKKHWPNVPIFPDITKLNKEILDCMNIKPDVVCGGFPCQDISTMGYQAGLASERSGLWFEYSRLIRELKPKWVLIENVTALRSNGLDTILQNLWSLGYDAEWHCIPASTFDYLFERDRLWILAYPKGRNVTAPIITGIDSFNSRFRRESLTDGIVPLRVYRNNSRKKYYFKPRNDFIVDGLSYGLVAKHLKAIGNSIVPEIAEFLGSEILSCAHG